VWLSFCPLVNDGGGTYRIGSFRIVLVGKVEEKGARGNHLPVPLAPFPPCVFPSHMAKDPLVLAADGSSLSSFLFRALAAEPYRLQIRLLPRLASLALSVLPAISKDQEPHHCMLTTSKDNSH